MKIWFHFGLILLILSSSVSAENRCRRALKNAKEALWPSEPIYSFELTFRAYPSSTAREGRDRITQFVANLREQIQQNQLVAAIRNLHDIRRLDSLSDRDLERIHEVLVWSLQALPATWAQAGELHEFNRQSLLGLRAAVLDAAYQLSTIHITSLKTLKAMAQSKIANGAIGKRQLGARRPFALLLIDVLSGKIGSDRTPELQVIAAQLLLSHEDLVMLAPEALEIAKNIRLSIKSRSSSLSFYQLTVLLGALSKIESEFSRTP